MNVNTPLIYTAVKWCDITQDEQSGTAECRIFGACSIPGKAILFHCQLNNGAVYYRLPISAFGLASDYPLHVLQPWDCPSSEMEVITYDWLANQRVSCRKIGDMQQGRYLCTFDWKGAGTTAEIAHEHKCLHLIQLDNGQYALQPNNYLLWHEKSNTVIDGSHALLRPNKEYPSVEELSGRNK